MNIEWFFNLIGWNSDFLLEFADVLSYFIPSTNGVDKLMSGFEPGALQMEAENHPIGRTIDAVSSGVFFDGFSGFDWQLFGFVIVSCLPFFLLSYYLMLRKEF